MNLYILKEQQWQILAAMSPDMKACPLQSELEILAAGNYRPTVQGILNLFEMLAAQGPSKMSNWIHEASKPKKIFEITKGDIRIYFFYGKDRIVICSHSIVKRRQKVDSQDVDRAYSLKLAYERASQTGNINIERKLRR